MFQTSFQGLSLVNQLQLRHQATCKTGFWDTFAWNLMSYTYDSLCLNHMSYYVSRIVGHKKWEKSDAQYSEHEWTTGSELSYTWSTLRYEALDQWVDQSLLVIIHNIEHLFIISFSVKNSHFRTCVQLYFFLKQHFVFVTHIYTQYLLTEQLSIIFGHDHMILDSQFGQVQGVYKHCRFHPDITVLLYQYFWLPDRISDHMIRSSRQLWAVRSVA